MQGFVTVGKKRRNRAWAALALAALCLGLAGSWREAAVGAKAAQPAALEQDGADRAGISAGDLLPALGIDGDSAEVYGVAAPVSGGDGALPVSGGEAVSGGDAAALEEASAALARQVKEDQPMLGLVYMAQRLEVLSAPDEYPGFISLPSGHSLHILGMELDGHGRLWLRVGFYDEGRWTEGYAPRSHVATADPRFLEWEQTHARDSWLWNIQEEESGTLRARSVSATEISQFPASYRAALVELKRQHPNWIFVPHFTGRDWNTYISQQLGERSLIAASAPEAFRQGAYGGGRWHYASAAGIAYYLDPRNFLQEDRIFQFELLSYNAQYHDKDTVEQMLAPTFMATARGYAPGTHLSYATIIFANGRELGMSPYFVVRRLIQEQGVYGTSPLISGNYTGGDGGLAGYYNYFNIGASGSNAQEEIVNGLVYARAKLWNTAYESIRGGMQFLARNYISKGQDTTYGQKFDLVNASPYHQYMQNIQAPYSEAAGVRNAYAASGNLEQSFVFKIPVFANMPQQDEGPAQNFQLQLQLPEGYATAQSWIDGELVEGSLDGQNLRLSLADAGKKTAIAYRYDQAGIPVGMAVWELYYNGITYEARLLPAFGDMFQYHGFSIRIVGRSGIRCTNSISASLKEAFGQGRVEGYALKEYGTLVMRQSNREILPMVRGGLKVQQGAAFISGGGVDNIYALKEGRSQFTSVLVGLPAEEYKTEFAYRAYALLEKDGENVVIYGPAMARSIYVQAQRWIDRGYYPQGGSADLFLRQLLADGDGAQTAP